jgi:hypothetical protein
MKRKKKCDRKTEMKFRTAVTGFSLFDKIRNEDSPITKTEGTRGVIYYTCAKLFYRLQYKLNGTGLMERVMIC